MTNTEKIATHHQERTGRNLAMQSWVDQTTVIVNRRIEELGAEAGGGRLVSTSTRRAPLTRPRAVVARVLIRAGHALAPEITHHHHHAEHRPSAMA
jgi:hypothetical protein